VKAGRKKGCHQKKKKRKMVLTNEWLVEQGATHLAQEWERCAQLRESRCKREPARGVMRELGAGPSRSAPGHPIEMKINVNDTAKVRLTQTGRDELKRQHDELYSCLPVAKPAYREPKEDDDGWVEFQLWNLMSRLGHLCQMGFQVPFHTEIEINV
jgi:hypothetical protein